MSSCQERGSRSVLGTSQFCSLGVANRERGSHHTSRRPRGAGYALIWLLSYFQSCVWAGASGASRCLPSVPQVLTSLSGITPGALSKNVTHLPWYVLKSSMRTQVPLREHHTQVKGQSYVTLDEFGVTLKWSSFRFSQWMWQDICKLSGLLIWLTVSLGFIQGEGV